MRVPPEIVDRIIDHLHHHPETLMTCSLVARDWVPSARLHLFAKLTISSAYNGPRSKKLASILPNILHYCQELTLTDYPTQYFIELPPMIHTYTDGFTPRTLHIRLRDPFPRCLVELLVAISEKITTLTLAGNGELESCQDLWRIIRIFPNLRNVHVSDLGYSSRKGGLTIPPGYCHSPPIVFFSFHSHCLGYVIKQLARPPYPLKHLKSLAIHHTGQKQPRLDSVAIKYRDTITTLKFGANTINGSGTSVPTFPTVPQR
jgi:hypothetical protein